MATFGTETKPKLQRKHRWMLRFRWSGGIMQLHDNVSHYSRDEIDTKRLELVGKGELLRTWKKTPIHVDIH